MNMAIKSTAKRVRKSPEERRAEVLDAAVRLISERGFNGISIQDVADRVGISKQGVLRYVGNKDNLLSMVYREYYNRMGSPEDFMASGLPGSARDRLLFPAYLRYLVQYNAQRRMLVQMFTMLQTESFNPSHPLHDEFAQRYEGIWQGYSLLPWLIPEPLRPWQAHMKPVVRRAMEVMDGVQLQWLSNTEVDLVEEWMSLEPMLFPSPQWDGYR
ncbi:TetR family transcriptional regulator [Bifidobacterium tsurumiense]|uniref:TetR family transcriptional regulator n=2 Tax=Bifidobacterium tsurumiense TaxID=356829 RepID=A0A087EK04_9BIFI|nr:TetR family transcriptional regulator [Bifidobacterium tsurumiense]